MEADDRSDGEGAVAATRPGGDAGRWEATAGDGPGDKTEESSQGEEREATATEAPEASAKSLGHLEARTQTEGTREVAAKRNATVDKGIQTDGRQRHCCGAAVEAPDPALLQPQQNTAKSGIQQIIECFRTGTTQLKHLLLREVDTIFECRACRSLFRGLPNLVLHKEAYCCSWERLPEPSTSGKADRQSQAVKELLEAIYPRADRQEYVIKLEPISSNSNAVFQSALALGEAPPGPTAVDPEFGEAAPPGDGDASGAEPSSPETDAASSGPPQLPPPPPPDVASSVNRMCRICGKVFASRKSTRRHIKVIHRKPPEEVGRFIGGARRTMGGGGGEASAAAESPAPSPSRASPSPPASEALGPPAFAGKSCPLCSKSFATKANARRHFDEVHLGVRRDPGAIAATASAITGSVSARGSAEEDDDDDDSDSSDGDVDLSLSGRRSGELEASGDARPPAFPAGWGDRPGAAADAGPGRGVTCASASTAAKRSGVALALGVSDAMVGSLEPIVNLSCVVSSRRPCSAKRARASADDTGPDRDLLPPPPANGAGTVGFPEAVGDITVAETPQPDPSVKRVSRRKSSTPMSRSAMELLMLLQMAPHSPASSCDPADPSLREPGEVVRGGAEEERQQRPPFRTSTVETRAKRRSVGADGYGYGYGYDGAGRSGPAADWDMETKMCLRCHRQYTTAQTLKRHMLLIHRRDIGRVEGDSDSSSGGDGAGGRRQRRRRCRRRRDRTRRSRQRAPHRTHVEAEKESAPAGAPRDAGPASSSASSADDSDGGGGGGGERCDACTQKFPTKAGLKRHVCSAHGRHDDGLGRSQQLLALAARTARAAQGRRLRLSLGFDMKRLYCKLCKRCFTNRANMLRHIELHSDRDEGGGIYVKFYRCPLCAYETRRKRDVVRHITMVHKKRSRDLAKIVGGLESRAVKKPIDAFLSRGRAKGPDERAGDPAADPAGTAAIGAPSSPPPAPPPPPAPAKLPPCRAKSPTMANGRVEAADAATAARSAPAPHKCPVCRKAFAKKTCLALHRRAHRHAARAVAARAIGAGLAAQRVAAEEEKSATKSLVRHTRSKALQPGHSR
ncbi:zinc finger protein 800 [Petromyzon marinus]|uniref:zinc finger protein 800 n=1 Tax=Petromyzon marinus TaxID=7757 RepID=UPI003F719C33